MSNVRNLLAAQEADAKIRRDRIEAMKSDEFADTAGRMPKGAEKDAMVQAEKASLEPIERHIEHLKARLAGDLDA